jgi:hypothetical protein
VAQDTISVEHVRSAFTGRVMGPDDPTRSSMGVDRRRLSLTSGETVIRFVLGGELT